MLYIIYLVPLISCRSYNGSPYFPLSRVFLLLAGVRSFFPKSFTIVFFQVVCGLSQFIIHSCIFHILLEYLLVIILLKCTNQCNYWYLKSLVCSTLFSPTFNIISLFPLARSFFIADSLHLSLIVSGQMQRPILIRILVSFDN